MMSNSTKILLTHLLGSIAFLMLQLLLFVVLSLHPPGLIRLFILNSNDRKFHKIYSLFDAYRNFMDSLPVRKESFY